MAVALDDGVVVGVLVGVCVQVNVGVALGDGVSVGVLVEVFVGVLVDAGGFVGVSVGVAVGVASSVTLLSVFDVTPSTVAKAVLVTEPVVTSAAVTVYVAVQVMLSPGSR